VIAASKMTALGSSRCTPGFKGPECVTGLELRTDYRGMSKGSMLLQGTLRTSGKGCRATAAFG
jgi:hypothetical protein